mmetsp:Transcript_2177/g.6630  ORF Transcript_2177/g.6630 Transcript_2177/m.6630 type:complete len:695 (+) Transcript_2177:77-2161(+)
MASGGSEKAPAELARREGAGRRGPTTPGNVATPARGGRPRDGNASGDKARGPASALEELMRRKGVDEAWCTLEEMQRQGITTDKYTVSRMLMKTVGDGRTRLNPSRVYRGIALVERFIDMQPKDVDEVLFNALLDTCCRLKDLGRLEAIVAKMRELKVTPSPVTLGILVKTYGQAGDLQKVLQVWSEMEKQRGQANAVTYGCMIDACVKCGHLEKAVEIFKGMRQAGKHRNTILYTTLIKGYGMEKDLASALELFREMPRESVPYNTITFNSILDACIKCGDLATAEGLLREMLAPESSLEPDLITFSTLLKGYCHVGELDKALQVAEAIKARGLRCDELVYNTLMDGCVKANDITAGVGLFEEMVQNGMRPSAITHSILARLYQRAGYEEDAPEAVAQLYQQHGIERPSGGERSKGFGRRGLRSPGGRAADHAGQSPLGSPTASSGPTLQRDRSDSAASDHWASLVPMLPGFEDPSAPSTPSASLQPSPMHAAGPYLPLEAIRGFHVPPMPGTEHAPSPMSSPSAFPHPCGPVPPSAAMLGGSSCVVGSPCGSPPNAEAQTFGMPASPHGMQQLFGLLSAQMPTPQQAGQAPMPPWPFMCGPGFQGAGMGAVPPSPQDPGLQQSMMAMSMLQGTGPFGPAHAEEPPQWAGHPELQYCPGQPVLEGWPGQGMPGFPQGAAGACGGPGGQGQLMP